MDDAVDLSRQLFKGALLLGVIGMAIIGAPDPADNVPETSFGDVGIDAASAHEAPGGPSQIVQSPASHSAFLVKSFLNLEKPPIGALPVGGNVLVALDPRESFAA
jgi:hypothetical protein